MQASELREMTGDELVARLKELQDSILHFRMNQVTGVVENTSAAKQARRDIARIKTVLREREIAQEKGSN